MLSKKKFIEYLERYKELADIEEKLNSAVKLLCPDFNNFYLELLIIRMINFISIEINIA